MGDGADGRPIGSAAGRLGYRPPPHGWFARSLIILTLALVGAVVAVTVVDLVADYHAKLRVIDRVTGEYGTTYREAIPKA